MKLHVYFFLSIIHISRAVQKSEESTEDFFDVIERKETRKIRWTDSEEDFFWRELGRNSYPPSEYSS